MKTNAIVRIILFSLAILLLLSILLGVVCFNMFIVDGRVQIDRSDSIETPVEVINHDEISSQIRNIKIEWVAGNIVIRPSSTVNGIQITESAVSVGHQPMVLKQSGQTLTIKFCEDSVKFSSFGVDVDYSKDLFIAVPENWSCNDIEIDAAATDVEIHDLQINELDFDGASGKLTLDNCSITELDIDTASGDVEFTGTLKELDFDAASARFDGEFLQVPRKLNLDAMSGDLTIVLPEDSGFYLELDTMSGSFDSDFDFHTTGAHYECGDGACRIKVSAMSGNVQILKGISAAKNCDH